nr:hypothetical protein GZ27A8_32 [uncultured archaeon GZfos27A8]
MYPIWVQLKSQSSGGKHPQQTFANTKSHIIRTGTANAPLIHQTALKYETAVSDGGRLELKTPKGHAKARSSHCAVTPGRHERFRRGHPKAPGLWDDSIERSGTGTICPIGRDNLWRDLRFAHGLMAKPLKKFCSPLSIERRKLR